MNTLSGTAAPVAKTVKKITRSWSRLIRFRSGHEYLYGEPILPPGSTFINEATTARVIRGEPFGVHKLTTQVKPIEYLCAPILKSNINAIRCLGLNYHSHAQETNLPIPSYPVLFYKPRYAIADPKAPLVVPRVAQDPPTLDYECELVVVIGQRCKDVSPHQALLYVGGYTVGNDISHREWQLQRGGGQWNFGKGFDKMTPLGPGIIRKTALSLEQNPGKMVGAGKGLRLWTKVNGEIVQEGWTGDMIFGVKQAVSFLSQGTTLFPGDLIFMGTPSGVGMSRKPPRWLKHGDLVEVGMDTVGVCTNYINFENEASKEAAKDGKSIRPKEPNPTAGATTPPSEPIRIRKIHAFLEDK